MLEFVVRRKLGQLIQLKVYSIIQQDFTEKAENGFRHGEVEFGAKVNASDPEIALRFILRRIGNRILGSGILETGIGDTIRLNTVFKFVPKRKLAKVSI